MIGQVITVVAIGAPFVSTAFMLAARFYAQEDARTPFMVRLHARCPRVHGGRRVVIAHSVPPEQMVFAVAGCYALPRTSWPRSSYHYALKRRMATTACPASWAGTPGSWRPPSLRGSSRGGPVAHGRLQHGRLPWQVTALRHHRGRRHRHGRGLRGGPEGLPVRVASSWPR
ncbi:hypothetical protein QJS66_14280 [Kocuria rhizophila]|nr:hypothetical protein QJS66_14280 [Kocuria rhizophila]